MIRCMLLKSDKSCTYGDQSLIELWQQNPSDQIWIDFDGHQQDEERRLLKELGCHSLAITDAQRDRHPPKIELFDNYIFMLYRGIYHPGDDLVFDHLQISMFVGTNIVITSHRKTSMSIDKLFSEEGQKYLSKSPITLA
ncbi:MAG: CorA family divalent cation transporter, partial [Psychromonas sp.]